MRLMSFTVLVAILGATAPALAQAASSSISGPPGPAGINRQPLAPAASPTVKALSPSEKRLIEEQKRLERIMTICIGC